MPDYWGISNWPLIYGDSGLIFHMNRELCMKMRDIEHMVYKESGLLGVSGVSNDMRAVEAAAAAGNERCQLALDKFAFMAKKYCGAFAAAMGSAVFRPYPRSRVLA